MSVGSTGVLLKTSLLDLSDDGRDEYAPLSSRTEPILNRILLYDGRLHEQQTVRPYVPPLFLLIICERTPFGRYLRHGRRRRHSDHHTRRLQRESGNYVDDVNDDPEPAEAVTGIVTTDVALKENEIITMELLKAAVCTPDKVEHSFLRLEHAGSLQSEMNESFPVPALRIGRMARLTFETVCKRNRALDVLNENASANSDVYAINYSSNACVTTVTRYLEPLFRHAMRLQKAWSVTDEDLEEEEEEEGRTGHDDGVFDVNFHVFDPRPTPAGGEGDERREDRKPADRPIFVIGSSSSARSAETEECRARTTIRERAGRASPLTVHDVSRFYAHRPFYGDRDGAAAELQSLAVVLTRHERDFFL